MKLFDRLVFFTKLGEKAHYFFKKNELLTTATAITAGTLCVFQYINQDKRTGSLSNVTPISSEEQNTQLNFRK